MNHNLNYSDGPIMPLILRFSIPAALSMLIIAVYNIVDRIFVGNIVGSTALAALSICFPLSFIMIAFGLMCSAGGSSIFVLLRGKKDYQNANLSFSSAVWLTIGFELILTWILLLYPDFFLKIFGVTDTTYFLSKQYYRIVAFGCLFQGLTMVFADYVRVSGRPILGMSITALGAVTNIILDAIFIGIFKWGVEGAALATIIGQMVSALFGGWQIATGNSSIKLRLKDFKLDRKISLTLLSCGFAFWVAQMAMGFIALIYNSQLGKYGGDTAIGIYAIVSSIMTFILMPASGISQGIQPLVGYNYSQGNAERVKNIFLQGVVLSVGITGIIWIIAQLFPGTIINLFGGGRNLLEMGIPALRVNFIFAPALGFVLLATTFFQSLGKPAASTIITLMRQVILLIPLIYILGHFYNVIGIFYAQPLSDLVATIISLVLITTEFKKMMVSFPLTMKENI